MRGEMQTDKTLQNKSKFCYFILYFKDTNYILKPKNDK